MREISKKIFFCCVFQLALRFQQSSALSTFSRETRSNSKITPYERCLMYLPRLDANFSLYNQPKCNYNANHLITSHCKFSGACAENAATKLNHECIVRPAPVRVGVIPIKSMSTNILGQCLARLRAESEGFRSTWMFPQHGNIDYFDPSNFFNVLGNSNIKKIVFAGDSVTEQVFKFLLCDLSRLENVEVEYVSHLTAKVTINEAKILFERVIGYMSHAIDPSQQKNLINRKLLYYAHNLFQDISRKGSISGRTLLIFNQGLHITKSNNTDRIIQHLSSKLINFAKSHITRFYVMFLETSAPHFSTLPGGEYDVYMPGDASFQIKPGDYCCDNNHTQSSVESSNWRNRKFSYYLTREDPSWSTYVSWLPFFNLTRGLYDVHMEVNHHSLIDCTHFAYVPFLFAPLWYDIESNLYRLLQSKYRNIPYNTTQNEYLYAATPPALIKNKTNPSIYLLQNGVKRRFSSSRIIGRHGYNARSVAVISDFDFNEIPEGDVILK